MNVILGSEIHVLTVQSETSLKRGHSGKRKALMLIPQGQRAVSRGRTLMKINILPNIGRSSREPQPHLWLTRDTLLFPHKYPRPTQRAKPRKLSRNDSAKISAVVCEGRLQAFTYGRI